MVIDLKVFVGNDVDDGFYVNKWGFAKVFFRVGENSFICDSFWRKIMSEVIF